MTLSSRHATATALAAVVAFGVPAGAHAPRDAKPGGPTMDLEIQVTPPLAGSVSPGGRDAVVAVDAYGNRFAVARKEPPMRGAGVDPRARTLVRSGYWQWTSTDDGATWTNLETLPRGADAMLPEGTAYAVASQGRKTYLASTTPTGTVVMIITTSGRGKIASVTQSVMLSPRGLAGGLQVAPYDGGAFVVAAEAVGTSVRKVEEAEVGLQTGSSVDGSACGAAATGTAPRTRLVLTCLEAGALILHSSTDEGRTFARRALGPPDARGSGAASVDLAPDGTAFVLSGTRLWRVPATGRVTTQDVASDGGEHPVTSLAVSRTGRIGIAAYRRLRGGSWNVVVTIFTSGRAPVWSDFAAHDPVSPAGAAEPASGVISVDFDDKNRVQVLWTATQLQSAELDRPLLRNTWSVRSVTT